MKSASVLIPVYNAEEYLARCLDSVINQTYHELQIIVVNDGSTDATASLMQEYAARDARIEVIHQKNGGVSSARNTGLKKCRGEYIFFVDADDYLEPEYIEHYLLLPDAPFIGGGYIDSTGWRNQYDDLEISTDDYRRSYTKGLQRVPSVHVTGNRYKKDIIELNALAFDEGVNCGEDSRFNANYFGCIDRLLVTSNCEYHYTVREDSLINRFIPDRLDIEREECKVREKLFFPAPEFCSVIYIHWHITLEHYFSYLSDNAFGKEAKQDLRKAIRDKYFRRCLPYMMKNGTKDMKLEGMSLSLLSYRMYKRVLNLVLKHKQKSE